MKQIFKDVELEQKMRFFYPASRCFQKISETERLDMRQQLKFLGNGDLLLVGPFIWESISSEWVA